MTNDRLNFLNIINRRNTKSFIWHVTKVVGFQKNSKITSNLNKKKGIVVSTQLLVTIIFVVIAALIIFMLWMSFSAEAGTPASTIFYIFLDWITSFLS